MSFGGYAFMSNVVGKIKTAPFLWLPYMIVPLKTSRQTGFLFPRFSFSGNGVGFIQPFFWAISRSVDMTVATGWLPGRGPCIEWEGRYSITPRSQGQVNFFYTYDLSFALKDPASPTLPITQLNGNRWGINLTQSQELPFRIDEKIKFTWVGDNFYPFQMPGDVPGAGEVFLPSSVSLSYPSSIVSAYAALTVYRNLISTDPTLSNQIYAFDASTVQDWPSLGIAMNDRLLGGAPVAMGVQFSLHNFYRPSGPFDYDRIFSNPISRPTAFQYGQAVPFGSTFLPGVDPIRQALRLSLFPTLYTTWSPTAALTIIPSLQYRGFYYHFPTVSPEVKQDMFRGYLLFQTELGSQIERIYEFPNDKDIPRAKHLIRPKITYSLSLSRRLFSPTIPS
jgi:LPS-assembly protein